MPRSRVRVPPSPPVKSNSCRGSRKTPIDRKRIVSAISGVHRGSRSSHQANGSVGGKANIEDFERPRIRLDVCPTRISPALISAGATRHIDGEIPYGCRRRAEFARSRTFARTGPISPGGGLTLRHHSATVRRCDTLRGLVPILAPIDDANDEQHHRHFDEYADNRRQGSAGFKAE